MKIKLVFLCILTLPCMTSFSQKVWTLSDCIEYAHANNIQIKRTELQADMARVDVLQSKVNLLPDLNASLGRNYSFGRQVDPFTNEYTENNFLYDNYSVTSNVALFNGLQNYNNIKRSHFASLAAWQNVEKEKVEKTMEISTAYLEILYQQELVDVARNQMDVTRLQVDRTRKLVEAGSVAKGDLLEIQAQLANENLNITNSRNQLNLSLLNLIQLLDLDSAGGFEIVTPDTIDPERLPALPAVTEIFSDALDFMPHVKMAEYQLRSNEKALLVQKGRQSPMVYLSGSVYTGYSDQRFISDNVPAEVPIGYLQGNPDQLVVAPQYGTAEYPYGDQITDNIAQSLSVGINIPIFNRLEVRNGISKARIQVEDSEYQLDQVKQQLYKSIQQAHNDAVSARDRYNSATEAVSSYRESFHYTEQKYNVGIVNSVEYNIAKNNLIKAESQLLQAKYELIFATKILDFYRGIPISL